LGVPGGIKFIWTSPLRQCCKLQQRFPSQIGKKCLQSCTKKNLVRKYCSKIFLNEVHFLNKFYKPKFSKMNAMFKNINKKTKYNIFWNNFEKSVLFQVSHIFLLKQPEIRPISNIARLGGMFLLLHILGGWWLDRLPYRRHFKLIAAIQCTF